MPPRQRPGDGLLTTLVGSPCSADWEQPRGSTDKLPPKNDPPPSLPCLHVLPVSLLATHSVPCHCAFISSMDNVINYSAMCTLLETMILVSLWNVFLLLLYYKEPSTILIIEEGSIAHDAVLHVVIIYFSLTLNNFHLLNIINNNNNLLLSVLQRSLNMNFARVISIFD